MSPQASPWLFAARHTYEDLPAVGVDVNPARRIGIGSSNFTFRARSEADPCIFC